MNVVIMGGNDCMVCRYKNLCKKYNCQAKVFTQMEASMKNRIGSPDLLVLFTGALSHKMLRCVLDEVDENETEIVRNRSGSMSALKNILETHVKAS
ncbi:hypothetical protein SAMN05216249_10652 [Acetitomaculum ruminis DSM 5522]|uniref:DUF2325 domain-containing protein n=1 Tax=Acetitomaculum ruminis DSM 5522 TaxID=1120918 RepID=A0A1I0XC15_9FIRM|nr:DUF2325 domain-containing protein [Acetitomaculum ruminis]SFA97966.1 hypothetical protein SAMN05216249_10652 [Acetitomaculum ruminis DSM 5522]